MLQNYVEYLGHGVKNGHNTLSEAKAIYIIQFLQISLTGRFWWWLMILEPYLRQVYCI